MSNWVIILSTGFDKELKNVEIKTDRYNNLCVYSKEGELNCCYARGYWLFYSRIVDGEDFNE